MYGTEMLHVPIQEKRTLMHTWQMHQMKALEANCRTDIANYSIECRPYKRKNRQTNPKHTPREKPRKKALSVTKTNMSQSRLYKSKVES